MKPTNTIHARSINGSTVSIYTRVPFTMTIGEIPTLSAPFLAADLLRAYGVGKLGPYMLTCPKCQDGLVNIIWYPGAPGRHTMRNGDPGYPPEPAYVNLLPSEHVTPIHRRTLKIVRLLDVTRTISSLDITLLRVY
jgi:hypothetical protein